MKSNEELKKVIAGMCPAQLSQAVVLKDDFGDTYTVEGFEVKEYDMFYDGQSTTTECYTESQMRQMHIPKEQWMFDHVKRVTVLRISKL